MGEKLTPMSEDFNYKGEFEKLLEVYGDKEIHKDELNGLKNKVTKTIGTVPVIIDETDSSKRHTILGLSFTNLTNQYVYVSVLLNDDTSVEGYYLKDSILPAGSSLRAVSTGEKLILAPNNILKAVASVDDSVDVIVSYVETS